jgi:hypothetical protein
MRIIFSLIAILFFNACIGQELLSKIEPDTALPKTWKNMEFLEELGSYDALIWLDKKDERPFEVRSCFAVFTDFDSVGNMQYHFKHIYSNDSRFKNWNISSIHYSPDYSESTGELLAGFWDIHLETFDHQPSKKEVEALVEKWHFSMLDEGWKMMTFGVNKKLWIEILGFVPEFEIQKTKKTFQK